MLMHGSRALCIDRLTAFVKLRLLGVCPHTAEHILLWSYESHQRTVHLPKLFRLPAGRELLI